MSSQVDNVEGDWHLIDYPAHPECIGCPFKIDRDEKNPNVYHLQVHIVNRIKCTFEYVSEIDEWRHSAVEATKTAGSAEKLNKEHVIGRLIDNIEHLEVQGGQQLIIRTYDGDLILLEHRSPGDEHRTDADDE